MTNIEKDSGIRAALMYDPLTVFYLLQPALCQAQRESVLVETKGEITRGMTVADRRRVKDDARSNVTVVNHIKSQAFIDRFIGALSR